MIVISMVEDLTASQTKDYFIVIAKEPLCTLSLLNKEMLKKFWISSEMFSENKNTKYPLFQADQGSILFVFFQSQTWMFYSSSFQKNRRLNGLVVNLLIWSRLVISIPCDVVDVNCRRAKGCQLKYRTKKAVTSVHSFLWIQKRTTPGVHVKGRSGSD